MKCPWCSRDIGLPSPSRTSAQCPYCSGQYTYAFRGRTVLLYCVPAVLGAWLLIPYFGGIVIPIALALPLVAGVYLEKWF